MRGTRALARCNAIGGRRRIARPANHARARALHPPLIYARIPPPGSGTQGPLEPDCTLLAMAPVLSFSAPSLLPPPPRAGSCGSCPRAAPTCRARVERGRHAPRADARRPGRGGAARGGRGAKAERRRARGAGEAARRGEGRGEGRVVSPGVPGGLAALEACPALVLNADFQPLSYLPLSLWSWQDAVKAVFSERVTVVATYDVVVRSPSLVVPLPSVICLKKFRKVDRTPPFTRFNVFLRDDFRCQYCGKRLPTHELTFDHVVPRMAGGKTSWGNVVAACMACNHRKGSRLLASIRDMRLATEPATPTNAQLQAKARHFPPRNLEKSWEDYVYWSAPMLKEENDDPPSVH